MVKNFRRRRALEEEDGEEGAGEETRVRYAPGSLPLRSGALARPDFHCVRSTGEERRTSPATAIAWTKKVVIR